MQLGYKSYELEKRNKCIVKEFKLGAPLEELASKYYLTVGSVRGILLGAGVSSKRKK